ncbi:hypothetical protein LOK49_LG04G02455 [Camellia lanceoleosa]|uniref:Uncharacterized protein n=1 Tax=Camellia lanceoleosa TaxID=1840588 RepID=A0ACC0HZU5_9ERIC|nr:hypothetical protein LOK49_LG04G02455 [Camellia lanceoleosa]
MLVCPLPLSVFPLLHLSTTLEDPNNNPSLAADSPFYSPVFLSLPSPKPISNSTISQLFFDSLALSAWKTTGFSTWTHIPSRFFPKFFPQGSFLIGFSSIFWREAWKYSKRAFQYCNHDVGHAIAAVSMAAAGLGWDVKILDGLGYGDLAKLMGLEFFPEFKIPSRPVKGKLPEIEFEHPDCVLVVFPNGVGEFDVNYKELNLAILEFRNWSGK